ncbi:MAG TPA: hypothetical protein EYP19_10910 [Desulfobacterales bacterium]|nr:hypothetical protein [Desulfobacterales bacterium]
MHVVRVVHAVLQIPERLVPHAKLARVRIAEHSAVEIRSTSLVLVRPTHHGIRLILFHLALHALEHPDVFHDRAIHQERLGRIYA